MLDVQKMLYFATIEYIYNRLTGRAYWVRTSRTGGLM
jgi:hypothetical protein